MADSEAKTGRLTRQQREELYLNVSIMVQRETVTVKQLAERLGYTETRISNVLSDLRNALLFSPTIAGKVLTMSDIEGERHYLLCDPVEIEKVMAEYDDTGKEPDDILNELLDGGEGEPQTDEEPSLEDLLGGDDDTVTATEEEPSLDDVLGVEAEQTEEANVTLADIVGDTPKDDAEGVVKLSDILNQED